MPATFRPGMHHEGRDTMLGFMVEATKDVECCLVAGGRSWEVGFHLAAFVERLRNSNASLARALYDCMGDPNDSLGEVLYGIFCGPKVCEDFEIAPLAMERLLGNFCNLQLPEPPANEEVSADELSSWKNVSLDFVVAGNARCGTQSVLNNLYQHPSLDFTSGKSNEDYSLFSQGQMSKFVPTKKLLGTHRASYRGKGHDTQLLGLNNPGIATYPLSYYALYLMKKVKMIVVVCDPLRRLEKLFMYQHYCHENFDEAVRRFDAVPRHLNHRKDCDPSTRALIGVRRMWAKAQAFGAHLEELIKLLGHERLFIVHQASLRKKPGETYGRMAKWLGATEPFPGGMIFKRYNFRRGHRTDLCKNSTVQNVLKAMLASEYASIQLAIQWQEQTFFQPEALLELRSKQSRCDMSEELVEGPCGLSDDDQSGCPQLDVAGAV